MLWENMEMRTRELRRNAMRKYRNAEKRTKKCYRKL